ncbi:Uncharacterised protein [BD1-7 clade bacterium]|uniref:Copper chaperone PCu(A)C n=1 Tax=BD1-7 clade bacterium TaxID=2029982 RepID=A0A5S9MPQ9_9GAMM|nr:Uncharacterised protein [BD1-7 clade bacterium]CAA0085361.1 Uncharacterised protein [BD1-7 clade bacterium]
MTMASAFRQILLISLVSVGAFAVADGVQVNDAWVRGLPPGQPVTAAFLSLHNTGDSVVSLEQVSSPVAKRVELHSHAMVDGTMQMRKVEQLSLQPDETLVLAPGGYHLMLFGLQRPLRDGEEVQLNLCFDQTCVKVTAPVVSVLKESSHVHSGHAHHH